MAFLDDSPFVRIQGQLSLRRSTAAEWEFANPVLKDGEFGYERDTRSLKIGDGTTPWNELPYVNPGNLTANIYQLAISIPYTLEGDTTPYYIKLNERLRLTGTDPRHVVSARPGGAPQGGDVELSLRLNQVHIGALRYLNGNRTGQLVLDQNITTLLPGAELSIVAPTNVYGLNGLGIVLSFAILPNPA